VGSSMRGKKCKNLFSKKKWRRCLFREEKNLLSRSKIQDGMGNFLAVSLSKGKKAYFFSARKGNGRKLMGGGKI